MVLCLPHSVDVQGPAVAMVHTNICNMLIPQYCFTKTSQVSNMGPLIIWTRIQCYAIPSYPHRLITNLLHSSMDLLSTTCHVLKQTGDTRSACGLHSHPSSRCAALLCGETPEFLEFGARVSPQRLPPTVICTFLALGLPRVFLLFFFFVLLNAAKAHCKRIPPVWPRM